MLKANRPAKRSKRPSAKGADPTRGKLLAAASEVFAERGFAAATVREISRRAGANVAAVNYHFRNKLGLYTEVLRQAVASVGHDVARAAFDSKMPAEQMLRTAIKIFISRLYGHDRPSLPFRLMRHELLRPTPALSVVINEVMRPNYDRMRATVGTLLGLPPGHDTTRLSTHSVMGQVLFYPLAGPVIARVWPELKMTQERVEQIADHIANFSLAYLRGARTPA